ncbi:glutamate 5-kinase [Peribacillus sp. B-H-3]|uniref:glutamate 5-kinase n=1 Tax=Peribacillus sp. B-H-3 TaxID=3400420 RepID=UPI003B0144E2
MRKRIVVKIGSSSITDKYGEIDEEKFSDHIQAVAALRGAGHEVVLVSSGAVATGFKKLGYSSRPVTVKGKQAAAAVGQSILIQSYTEQFRNFEIIPAQILLTRNDFSKKDRYQNAYSTLSELLGRGILPIINENDTVSVTELTFGDNDMLSALVSGLVHADQLIILTDVNGLYDRNPHRDKTAKKIGCLPEITEDILRGAQGTVTKIGTGGMKSKLQAAKTALSLGVKVFIGGGTGRLKLLEILEGKGDGTYIGRENLSQLANSKQWISLHSQTAGKIFIDEGAEIALISKGSSLLPSGIFDISGYFNRGDVVEVYGPNGLLGRGEVLYSGEELRKSMGKRSADLGAGSIEVIHRDKWVNF